MKLERINPFLAAISGCRVPSSFLQTPFWASFKEGHGWKALYFALESGADKTTGPGTASVLLTVLVRSLGRFASIAYVPLGPAIDERDPVGQGGLLSEIADRLVPHLPSNTLCVRFDPPWDTGLPASAAGSVRDVRPPFPAGLRPAPAHIQPPDTVILDLSKTPDVLLDEMKPKWRYNIKLGEKKGVTVRFLEGEEGATEGIDVFYDLYLDTAKRDGIAVHSKDYYADLVRHAAQAGAQGFPLTGSLSVRVYFAEHDGTPLASIVTLFCGDEAVYLYGASSNEKRNLMPAYSLQWRAIIDAKAAGCERYDFYGIPPRDDPSHPMYGLYRFKTGFGGSIVHRTGSVDQPLRPFAYGLYRLVEAGRAFWYKKIVKMLRRETPRKS